MTAQSPEILALLNRVERVEKQNRFLKWAVLAVLLLNGGVLFTGPARLGRGAGQLVLKDASGNVRARLEVEGREASFALAALGWGAPATPKTGRPVSGDWKTKAKAISEGKPAAPFAATPRAPGIIDAFSRRAGDALALVSAQVRSTADNSKRWFANSLPSVAAKRPELKAELNRVVPAPRAEPALARPTAPQVPAAAAPISRGRVEPPVAQRETSAARRRISADRQEPALLAHLDFPGGATMGAAAKTALAEPRAELSLGPGRATAPAQSSPAARVDSLKKTERREVAQLTRSPFESASLRPRGRPTVLARPAAPPKAAPAGAGGGGPPPPSTGPPVTLRAFGYAEKTAGARQVFISDGFNLYVVKEGDMFGDRFTVLTVSQTLVELIDNVTNQTMRLTFGE